MIPEGSTLRRMVSDAAASARAALNELHPGHRGDVSVPAETLNNLLLIAERNDEAERRRNLYTALTFVLGAALGLVAGITLAVLAGWVVRLVR